MKSIHLALVSMTLGLATLPMVAFAQSAAAPTKAEASDDQQRIEHVMKTLFDKPESPLEVGPVAIERDYAVAGWAQGGHGGRALLKKDGLNWTIQVCGGDGLTKASNLSMTGMSTSTANALAHKVALGERQLPIERVKLFSLFKGTLKMGGAEHGHHPGAHSAASQAN